MCKVTPEMAKAGGRVIWTFFHDAAPGSDSAREAAIQAFSAMRTQEKLASSEAVRQKERA